VIAAALKAAPATGEAVQLLLLLPPKQPQKGKWDLSRRQRRLENHRAAVLEKAFRANQKHLRVIKIHTG
jgi:hypothetical protein